MKVEDSGIPRPDRQLTTIEREWAIAKRRQFRKLLENRFRRFIAEANRRDRV